MMELIWIYATIGLSIPIVALLWLIYKQITRELSHRFQLQEGVLSSQFKELQHQVSEHMRTQLEHQSTRSHLQVQGYLDQMTKHQRDQHEQMRHALTDNLKNLQTSIHQQMGQLHKELNQKLHQSVDKTHHIYQDVLKRLTLIDVAQKRIQDLSGDIMSLQDILSNKQTRGLLGESQLSNIIKNLLPEANYKFQYTLSNGKRADCVLMMPDANGRIVIDAKFPLENYKASQASAPQHEKAKSLKLFKQDILFHLKTIAEKYILPQETTDFALMFIPAESIFLEICHQYPDVIAQSQRLHVWMVSPTTMMAILNAVSMTLKDHATQKQVHIIQDHLRHLAKDFERFQKRMSNLATHIGQANQDVEDIHVSAKKITKRFEKIEKVEVSQEHAKALTDQSRDQIEST